MNYKDKYLKYKRKYLILKNQKGGFLNFISNLLKKNEESHEINIDIKSQYKRTIGSCIKELIEASYELYNDLIKENVKTTIVCGGQSPAYYCLAIMNFKIYDPNLINIIILPHSKGGVKTEIEDENKLYCDRLKEKGITMNNNVIIIDGVHTGAGILALESALKSCYKKIKNIKKYAINTDEYISQIPVDKTILLKCEPIFSDVFPRIINSYHPRDFHDSEKFKTKFNLKDNSIAQMIIDIAKNYPKIKVDDTDWYKLNNVETEEIVEENNLRDEESIKLKIQEDNRGESFIPIILFNDEGDKIYQCPECKSKSGTNAPLYPNQVEFFSHDFLCPNKFSVPKE